MVQSEENFSVVLYSFSFYSSDFLNFKSIERLLHYISLIIFLFLKYHPNAFSSRLNSA